MARPGARTGQYRVLSTRCPGTPTPLCGHGFQKVHAHAKPWACHPRPSLLDGNSKAPTVNRLPPRPQRTLARPAEVRGVGFLTGAAVRIRFVPAPPDTGVVFVRTDLRPAAPIPAAV